MDLKEKKRQRYLQVSPDVDISRWNLRCADKDVAAVASRTVDTDRVLASMGCCRIQGDFATLVAVCRIRGPCSLVPSVLETLAHLGNRWGREGESKEGSLAKHCLFSVMEGCL